MEKRNSETLRDTAKFRNLGRSSQLLTWVLGLAASNAAPQFVYTSGDVAFASVVWPFPFFSFFLFERHLTLTWHCQHNRRSESRKSASCRIACGPTWIVYENAIWCSTSSFASLFQYHDSFKTVSLTLTRYSFTPWWLAFVSLNVILWPDNHQQSIKWIKDPGMFKTEQYFVSAWIQSV